MAGNSATLDLIVKLDGADKATKGLSNMAKESGGLGKAFGTLTKVGLLGATAGIGLLVGGLGLAVKAAAEEEVGIKRLGGVLKNNIKDWDGNTAAVEKQIAANQRKGFADDQLRDSLGFLVTQTGNLTEAQNLQSTAMDLAASTGITLEKATRLVLKADDESYAALGKLGIQIDENATKEQALAAIREKTAGAAEAYSKTAAGAMEVIHNAFGDAVEDIGAVLLTKVTELMGGFADFISSPGFKEGLTSFVELLSNGIGKALEFIGPIIGTVVGKLSEFFGAVMSGDAAKITEFWDGIGGPIGFIGNALTTAAGEIGKFFIAVTSGDGEKVKQFFNDLFGEGSLLAGVGGFFVNATAEAAKFFEAMGLGTAVNSTALKVHSEEWNELYARNGAAEQKSHTAWDQFWERMARGVTEFDRIYRESAGLRAQNDAALKLHWDQFWVDVNRGSDIWFNAWKAWDDDNKVREARKKEYWDAFWVNVNAGSDVWFAAWGEFWRVTGQEEAAKQQRWDNFWSSMGASLAGVKEKFSAFFLDIGTSLNGIIKGAATIGSDIVKGIWSGISGGWAWLTGNVQKLALQLLQAAKNAIGIKSPSQAFADEVGVPIVEGVIIGMQSKLPEADVEAFNMGRQILAALSRVIPEAATEGVKFNDSFINGMKSRLPEADVAAYEMGKEVLAALHKGVGPVVEDAYAFFREYLGTAHAGLQALIGMMVADSRQGVADILAEWARLNNTTSNGVPLDENGLPRYQTDPGYRNPGYGGGNYQSRPGERGGQGGRPPEARAWGGNITAGMPYWVGELGRELIVPRTSGRVIPNGDLQIPERGRNYSGDLGQATTTIIIPVMLDGKKIAEVVSPHLEQRRALRNAYSI